MYESNGAWGPKDGKEAFKDRCLMKRGKGMTWRKIAFEEGVGVSTLYDYFHRNPEFKKEIKEKERAEQKDNIRQTLLEVALTKKNVVALIFLSKAICKLSDQPTAADPDADPSEKPVLHTGMTREEWQEKYREMQKKKEQANDAT